MKYFGALFLVLAVVGCKSTGSKKVVDDVVTGGSGSLQSQVEETGPEGVINPRGSDSGAIAGLETVRFGYDEASLSPEARRILQQNANWMKTNSYIIQIEGHCDSRGSSEYNLALGTRRAGAVKNYLMDLGIPEDRLRTVSYGEEIPLEEGSTESVYRKNRRANFIPTR